MLSSDKHEVEICERCGFMASGRGWCGKCGDGQGVTGVVMPYAAKLLLQELGSMNVGVRVGLEEQFPS